MTDMDWPIIEEQLNRSAEDVRRRRASKSLFDDKTHPPDELHLEREAATPKRARPEQRVGAHRARLYLGAGALGLLLLASVARMTGRHGPSITEPLPRATGTSNAVINLPPPNLLKPVSPEEATKENAERPFVNRPDTPASHFVLRTDAQDRDRAINCLTQAVYYEAAGEGTDGGRAVAQVVLNRMRHPGYPASVCGVIYQGADRAYGCQFTFVCDGSLLRTPVAS